MTRATVAVNGVLFAGAAAGVLYSNLWLYLGCVAIMAAVLWVWLARELPADGGRGRP